MVAATTHDKLKRKLAALEKKLADCRSANRDNELEARYRGVFEYTRDGVVVYRAENDGEDFTIIEFNRSAEKIEKIPREALIGKSVREVFPGILEFGLFEVFKRVWKSGRAEHFPCAFYKDNRITGWRANFVYKLPSGEIVAVYSDETERKKAEEALHRLNEELEQRVAERTDKLKEANRALQDSLSTLKQTQDLLVQTEKMAALGALVSGVAHEINTPLGICITAVSYLDIKTKELSQKLETEGMSRTNLSRFLRHMTEAAANIQTNLNRAADLVKSFKQVAVDQTNEERRAFSVRAYIDQTLMSLRPRYKRSNHKVTVTCPDELEIYSYPGVFSQVITNLVMNSLIHGFDGVEQGHITIDVSVTEDRLIFRYADDGIGMTADTAGKIYDPFFTTKRSQGGTGLGMHLVYNLVTQVLKGRIECASAPGKGVAFTITVPLYEKSE